MKYLIYLKWRSFPSLLEENNILFIKNDQSTAAKTPVSLFASKLSHLRRP